MSQISRFRDHGEIVRKNVERRQWLSERMEVHLVHSLIEAFERRRLGMSIFMIHAVIGILP